MFEAGVVFCVNKALSGQVSSLPSNKTVIVGALHWKWRLTYDKVSSKKCYINWFTYRVFVFYSHLKIQVMK